VKRTVVLLHGLWMPGVAMHWLARRLEDAGYDTEVFSYMSVADGPDRAVQALVEHIGAREVDLVAHSLGGLIAMQALRQAPQLKVGRLVCIGSPLSGSGAASGLLRLPMAAILLGQSATLLREGFPDWEGATEVGVVAGNSPHGLGALFAGFGGEHDGTVAVSETRLPGVKDHVVIAASHSGLLFSAEAADRTLAFLGSGRFEGQGA
jgi:pimeloyl-ACP methyl ester carboxylesterase